MQPAEPQHRATHRYNTARRDTRFLIMQRILMTKLRWSWDSISWNSDYPAFTNISRRSGHHWSRFATLIGRQSAHYVSRDVTSPPFISPLAISWVLTSPFLSLLLSMVWPRRPHCAARVAPRMIYYAIWRLTQISPRDSNASTVDSPRRFQDYRRIFPAREYHARAACHYRDGMRRDHRSHRRVSWRYRPARTE